MPTTNYPGPHSRFVIFPRMHRILVFVQLTERQTEVCLKVSSYSHCKLCLYSSKGQKALLPGTLKSRKVTVIGHWFTAIVSRPGFTPGSVPTTPVPLSQCHLQRDLLSIIAYWLLASLILGLKGSRPSDSLPGKSLASLRSASKETPPKLYLTCPSSIKTGLTCIRGTGNGL